MMLEFEKARSLEEQRAVWDTTLNDLYVSLR